MGTWTAKIDAHTGEIIAFADANVYGSIKGGVYLKSNLEVGAETMVPFPYANTASSTYANAAGVYSATSGTVTCTLAGKYVKVTDSCGSISLAGTAPADLTFDTVASTGTDCTVPSGNAAGVGNTHAARTTYYHETLWKEKAMGWLPSNTWLQGQINDKVNLSQTCNAYWDGTAVNFFKSGGGCSNTGELPTVFLHEIGHGLDANDGSPTSTVGSSEMYADSNAVLMTHQSCIGVNFIPGQQCSGYGNACTNCTGIRDADYRNHSSQTPVKPTCFTSACGGYTCSTDSSYPGPCGYEGHCESYIFSEAGFTLAANPTYGLMSKSGQDSNTAWFVMDRLFYLSRPTAGDAYTCSSPSSANGCGTSNWFMVYLAVDDDNGNLNDGTPHGAEIYKALNLHGVACSTYSSIVDSTTCTISQTLPTLTATPGSGSIGLSWTAVTGATGYVVLRNEISATNSMTILGTTTSTTYTDSVVATGITYYYSVVGYTGTVNTSGGGGSCIGHLAAVVSATPGTGTTYSISGTVSGAVTSGVTINLTGAATASTTTATGGTYTFSGLANGSYTVTPGLAGYTFSPTSTASHHQQRQPDGHQLHFDGSAYLYHLRYGFRRRHFGCDHQPDGHEDGQHHDGHRRHLFLHRPAERQLHRDAEPERLYLQPNQHGHHHQQRQPDSELHVHRCSDLQHLGHGQRRRNFRRDHQSHGRVHGEHHDGNGRNLYLQRPGKRQLHGDAEPQRLHLQPQQHGRNDQQRQPDGDQLHVDRRDDLQHLRHGLRRRHLWGDHHPHRHASRSTTTASGGTYTLSGLVSGSYTVTPSLSGYTFSPTSTAVTISSAS